MAGVLDHFSAIKADLKRPLLTSLKLNSKHWFYCPTGGRLSSSLNTELQYPSLTRGSSSTTVLYQLSFLSDQFEALRIEAVSLPAGHRVQQRLLLLRAARRLQFIHGGQVEEDALMEVLGGVLLNQALQLAQGLL